MAHILVIDDDADIHFILKEFFTLEGHQVDSAGDGMDGLRMMELNRYDLVITDVIMPKMNGLEVIAAIKQNFPDIRIVALTGGTAKIGKDLLLSTANLMRADRVIAKPLDLKVLKAAVNEVLAN